MNPVNLKELFGKRYRIGLDPLAKYEPGGKNDPWYYLVLCKFGHIYPYSDKLLAYYCIGTGTRKRLKVDHPEIEIYNWSDDGEAVFLFKISQFEMISEYAKPRRRRQISKKERKRLVEIGQETLFKSKFTAIKGNPVTPESTNRAIPIQRDKE